MSEKEIKDLSLLKLQIYLEQVREQIEYEVKIHGGEVKNEFIKGRKATVSDIQKLFGWINAR